MRTVDVIIKKRNNGELSQGEIGHLIEGYSSGQIPDYQMSSFAMAVYFTGMNMRETALLTEAMVKSGTSVCLSAIKGPKIDKHSTGGVGDKISIILAPLAAACGLYVPMMSGRGLGHTGGTLDKLESIPGYSTALTQNEFIDIISECGFAMTGQSKEIVPADRLFYSLRDVTGTVESIPLITASILSKKIAEGTEGLVLDVKCGKGAFMKDRENARKLAKSLIETGKGLGMKIAAVLTAMDQPLGRMVGNAVEINESIQTLRGDGPEDIRECTLYLNAWMLKLGGITDTIETGLDLGRRKLASGEALEKLVKNISLQKGKADFMNNNGELEKAGVMHEVKSPRSGAVTVCDAYKIGIAACNLGAGRKTKTDEVDLRVGIELCAKITDKVHKGDTICKLYARDAETAAEVEKTVLSAYEFADEAPAPQKLILEELYST